MLKMEKNEIYRRHQALEQEISVYIGDDPLKLRYDFISWLDGNYGRENVMETFVPVLEDTLKSFWNAVQYQQDVRFIQLLTTYINMQKNPLEMYKSVYDRGTGTESALFYTSWANAFVEKENYKKADEIYNLGLSKVKSKTELKSAYENFLVSLGKKYLHLSKNNLWETMCPKCCENQKSESAQGPPQTSCDQNVGYYLNPLKVGEKDDFKCPMFVEDPPDPSKISMYPKHLVYRDGKEYSLEEVRASILREKYKNKESENSKVLRHTANDASEKMTVQDSEDNSNEKEFCKENINQENNILQSEEEPLKCHTTPPKHPLFPKPLLLQDSLTVSQTSYTAHMKEAMNVVQEMWSSPSPAVPPVTNLHPRGRSLFGGTTDTAKEAPITDENVVASVPKKTPFSVYTEEEEEQQQPKNYLPTPTGAAKTGIQKAKTSVKKDPLQLKDHAKGLNVLSERKPKGNSDVHELIKRPSLLPNVKQQLPFSNVPQVEDNQNEMLAMKLGDVSISSNNQPPRITNVVKPILPHDQDDFTDVTCNTKAFNFSLPSSTPIQNKKFSGTRNSTDMQSSEPPSHLKSTKNPDLSMILEASKERYSSSSSSNNGIKGQSTVPPEICFKSSAEQDIDPFCPKLQAKLLRSVNFPQSYHSENYFVINSSFPTMAKTLKLGNETYNILGDIGKGAYARVVKASVKNRICALKVEKPACKWEHYICREIQKRVPPSVKSLFMDVKNTFIFNGGSILESDWAQYGNLLNITNQYKIATGKVLDSSIVLHFSIELVQIIDFLHQCQIIHADIKPDNFVVRSLPSCNETQGCIQLIDFGRSIDMRLLPAGTQFTTVVKTEGFTCCEMRERKPWTYQTDLYGLAATMHCLIFNEYMVIEKKNNEWKLNKPLPRNFRKLWEPIFLSLLNVESSEKLPSLIVLKSMLEDALNSKDKYVLSQNYRSLENILKGK
ncbi:hypothetical protein O3M35_005294 [Rhynocoris fuscipes]|uniref:Mitotic checkpoint serine/threonine-protein kinase BUB1 n=1 Tax=Rhynocoris fuscipes TaxID=488301 RepID=A0AAW1DK18_9HEMI